MRNLHFTSRPTTFIIVALSTRPPCRCLGCSWLLTPTPSVNLSSHCHFPPVVGPESACVWVFTSVCNWHKCHSNVAFIGESLASQIFPINLIHFTLIRTTSLHSFFFFKHLTPNRHFRRSLFSFYFVLFSFNFFPTVCSISTVHLAILVSLLSRNFYRKRSWKKCNSSHHHSRNETQDLFVFDCSLPGSGKSLFFFHSFFL